MVRGLDCYEHLMNVCIDCCTKRYILLILLLKYPSALSIVSYIRLRYGPIDIIYIPIHLAQVDITGR